MNPDQYCVFGNPIAHSKSPLIHAAFALQTGEPIVYERRLAPLDGFALAARTFAAEGGKGANVTVPFKLDACALATVLTPRAKAAGAVNTLRFDGATILGDNTDGAGLVADIVRNAGVAIAGKRVLLLGAGGAARGVAPALLDAGVGSLWIVNRSPEKADALSDALGEPERVHTRYLADLPSLGEFELIVNATSAGRGGEGLSLPFSLAAPRGLAVDLSYGEAAIAFMAWARAAGCAHCIDGLGMLVEQAAESFALWHGRRPDTDAVYAELSARADALHTAD